jgi:outer membrane protein assembly factor BamB
VEKTKILRCGLGVLAALCTLRAMAGCAYRNKETQKTYAYRTDSEQLVSTKLLEQAGLEQLWGNKLPIRESENLERLFILGNRLYGLSDRNYFVCLNREKGNVIFSRNIADAGLPVVGLGLYEGKLLSIVGNRLVEINPESGTETASGLLQFSAVCPAVRNSEYLYLAGTDRRLHALRSTDKVEIFEAAADNDSMITSIIADEQLVVFATTKGNCVCISPDKPEKLWQFDAADGIAGAIVRDQDSLVLASKDTNIYKIELSTGKLVWKYQTTAVLDKGPRATKDTVYQYVRDRGLAAIDNKSGRALWQLAEGVDLLAEAAGKAYVITSDSKLAVMDNRNAEHLYSVNFAAVSRYVTNTADSKIYIADKAGRIACLRPVE